MPNDSLTKEALLPEAWESIKSILPKRSLGNFLADVFHKRYGNVALKSPQDMMIGQAYRDAMREGARRLKSLKQPVTNDAVKRIALSIKHPDHGTIGNALKFDTSNTRAQQANAIELLTDKMLIPGAGIGAGLGLWRQYDKMKDTRNNLRNIPEYSEMPHDDEDEKNASVKKAEDDWGDKLKHLAEVVGSGAGKYLGGRGTVDSAMGAPMPFPGAMWTLAPLAVGAGVLGGDKLMDVTTDKIREAAIRRRKEKLRKAFYNRILYSKSASIDATADKILDAMYDNMMSKQALDAQTLSTLPVGYLALLTTLLGTGAFSLGYGISKGKDPLKSKAKALQLALSRDRLSRRYPVELIDAANVTAGGLGGQVDKSKYTLPVALNAAAPKSRDDEEAPPSIKYPDLQDLYALSKSSNAITDKLDAGKQYIANKWNQGVQTTQDIANLPTQLRNMQTTAQPYMDILKTVPPEQLAQFVTMMKSVDPKQIATLQADAAKMHGLVEGIDKFKTGFMGSLGTLKEQLMGLPGQLASGISNVAAPATTAAQPASVPAAAAPPAAKPPVPVRAPVANRPIATPSVPTVDSNAAIDKQRNELKDLRQSTSKTVVSN